MKLKPGLSRKTLMTVAVCAILLSLAMTAGGVLMIVFGVRFDSTVGVVLMIVFGALIALIGLGLLGISLVMLITSLSMIKTLGSLRDDNIAKVGTENVKLCSNCGNVIKGDYCTECGTNVNGKKVCSCGHENKIEDKFCVKCGEEF